MLVRSTQPPLRKKRNTNYIPFIKVLMICACILLIVQTFINIRNYAVEQLYEKQVLLEMVGEKRPLSLHNLIQKELDDTPGTYAIAVKDLNSNKEYGLNEHRSFPSASLYKVWTMISVFNKIQNGELTIDQTLSAKIPDLNREFGIPPEQAEQTAGVTKYSVQNALEQMIVQSDNYSSLLLTSTVKRSTLSLLLEKHELKESKISEGGQSPVTTASDMVSFFEKLYKGEFANTQYTNEMIALLKKQHFVNVLPKYLPKHVEIAHKTGALGFVSHDAGIVYAPFTTYVIALMSETPSPIPAEDKMARISEAVYKYYENEYKQIEKNNELVKIFWWIVTTATAIVVATIIYLVIKLRKKRVDSTSDSSYNPS